MQIPAISISSDWHTASVVRGVVLESCAMTAAIFSDTVSDGSGLLMLDIALADLEPGGGQRCVGIKAGELTNECRRLIGECRTYRQARRIDRHPLLRRR